jgi:uncharacterized membrane protein
MEELARNITLSVSHAVEILAAIIIGAAVLLVLWKYAASSVKFEPSLSKEAIRIQFGSSVAVALELMLGADVLATAVAPSWNDIGKLAAIAVIRTALNYFLEKELKHTRHTKEEQMRPVTKNQRPQRAVS